MSNNDEYTSHISIDKLMELTGQISTWERLSGSDEELEAFKFLEHKLNEYGVKTKLIMHDAYISIPLEGKLIVNGKEIYCKVPSMGKETLEEGLSGEIIYINNLSELSYELCEGKIVMINGRATYRNVSLVEEVGAIGVICVQQDRINECIVSNNWGSPTFGTKNLIPQIPSLSIDDKGFDEIMSMQKERMGLIVVNTDTGWRKIPLLIGDIKAPVKTEKYVMFSGHVDSWYHGSMDNGTANSTQLEIARVVHLQKEKLKRNLKIVFFSGHSQGRYAGSSWFADNYWIDLHYNCIINVNCDSIGGIGATDISHSMIMPEAKDLAIKIINKQTGENFIGSRCERKADQSFWINGVTSAFASFSRQLVKEETGSKLGWWWHTSEDTIDKIDPNNLLRDAKIFEEYIMSFLTFQVIPLNFYKSALEIKELIECWYKKSNYRFNLTNTIQIANKLVGLCKLLYSKDDKTEQFNDTIIRLGRILVPLNFTTGNIYRNDSCNEDMPMPVFKLIENLVNNSIKSTDENELLPELIHKRNFVEHSLIEAIILIESYIDNRS